jgi:outer membrane immunogenic protein
MKTALKIAAALGALAVALPAAAQDSGSWTGFYAGGRIGYNSTPNRANETVLFDRDLNGTFGDTITTAAGANAFSTGFCGGAATSTANTACAGDKDGVEWALHLGYDYQTEGGLVVGLVGEYGNARGRDAVSAFSTTPASYTLTRRLHDTYAIRARVGYAMGDTLAYATGGPVWGKVKNSFATSNTVNRFTTTGNDTANGYRLGAGVERKFGPAFSIGLQYLYSRYNDGDFRVRAANTGTTAATNPFLLGNPNGTDFARSEDRLVTHGIGLTGNFRF